MLKRRNSFAAVYLLDDIPFPEHDTDVGTDANTTLIINHYWRSIVAGLLSPLLNRSTWGDGDESDIDAAIEYAHNLFTDLYDSDTLVLVSPLTGRLPFVVAGQAYSLALDFDGGSGVLTYVIQSGVLPSGLSLGSSNGILAGTPPANIAVTEASIVLRVTDTFTGEIVDVNYSILVIIDEETSSQSLGSEQGSAPTWAFSADNPTGWSISGETGATLEYTQRASGQLHAGSGSGALNVFATSASALNLSKVIGTTSSWLEFDVLLSAWASGTFNIDGANLPVYLQLTATGRKRTLKQAVSSNVVKISNNSAVINATSDYASIKIVTLNTQSAGFANGNGSYVFQLVRPASPLTEDMAYMLYRIFGTKSRWNLYLRYTGTQWNLYLDSVTSGTSTNRLTATNVGAITMIGIHVSGDNHRVFTGTGDIDNPTWTQRGGTINNATHNTSNGVNRVFDSGFSHDRFYHVPDDIFV